MKKTIHLSATFERTPTCDFLPINKAVRLNYQQQRNIYEFIKLHYESYASRYGDILIFNKVPIIKTLSDYNNVKIKYNEHEYTLCIITEEVEASNQRLWRAYKLDRAKIDRAKIGLETTIYIYSFIHLIEVFVKIPLFFQAFIIDLRKNYFKSGSYNDNKNIEKNIIYFIKTLLY
jgi:hypothetical protein